MPPLHGVMETSLYVDDLKRSAEFYRRVFGFAVVQEGERLIALEVADRQLLLLFTKRGSAQLPTSPHDGEGELHLAFSIPLDSLAEWEAWLASQRVVIEEKHAWDLGGCSLYFRDPDRHLLEVATPGVWPRVY